MKLHRLVVSNFMPYKEMELMFPQNEQSNTMVILGENMRGKTSILNAIRWVFYGEAVKRHSQFIPLIDIVNRDAASNGEWTVNAQISFAANGNNYELRREATLKESVMQPSNSDDFKESTFLTRDGEPVPQRQIEEEIGLIAPKQLSRFFLFDGELLQEYEELLNENDPQGKKIKKAIEEVLGIPTLIRGREDIQTILKEARKEQQADLKHNKNIEQQGERYAELIATGDSIDRDLEELREKLEKIRREKNLLQDEIEAKEQIMTSKKRLDLIKYEQKSLNDKCQSKEKERFDILSEAWKDLIHFSLQSIRSELNQELREWINSIKKQGKLEMMVSSLEKLLDGEECPICKQTFNNKYQSEMNKILDKNKHELETVENSESTVPVSLQFGALSEIYNTDAKNRLEQVERDLDSYKIHLNRIDNEIEEFQSEIKEYDTNAIKHKKFLRDAKIKEEVNLLRDIKEQESKQEDINQELKVLQKVIEDVTKDQPSQKSTIKVSICSKLEQIFSNSIERLRDKLKKKVEESANEAFRSMITQKEYKGLKITDNYGLHIIDASGDSVAVRSAGAEQIVALSLIDGLNRTGRSVGPVIMDTPFGRLDLQHRDNVLKYFPLVTTQFVLLVHSGEIRENDLDVIDERIGITYKIKEVSSTCSRLERV